MMSVCDTIVEAAAAVFEVEPARVLDPAGDRVTPVVRARVVACYVMRQRLSLAFAAIARAVGYTDRSQARGSWMQGGMAVSSGERWMLDAVAEVERRLDSPRSGAPGLSEVEKLATALLGSQHDYQALARRVRRTLGKDVLSCGFPVKLGGLPFLVREVMIMREGTSPGSVLEEFAVRVEPRRVDEGLMLDGAAEPVPAGELPMVEVE